ncbi:MAG: hypothetical protein ACKV2T_19275 [Kofleriaceae bacterium]
MRNRSESNVPFADWDALVVYVKANWELQAVDGDSFEVVWEWSDDQRSQHVTFTKVIHDGDVWLSWASAIAETMTDAEIIEAEANEVGRIVREDGACWLEQHLPIALLTPRLLDRYSDSFAERADHLELQITGADHE